MKAFQIRDAHGGDLNFIYDTWMNSFRYDSSVGKSCGSAIFWPSYRSVIDRILSDERVCARVAASSDDPNLIFAYLIAEPKILHYAFCKEAFRRLGIATALFVDVFTDITAPVDYTHKTNYGREVLRGKPNFVHNPFHLYRKGAHG